MDGQIETPILGTDRSPGGKRKFFFGGSVSYGALIKSRNPLATPIPFSENLVAYRISNPSLAKPSPPETLRPSATESLADRSRH